MNPFLQVVVVCLTVVNDLVNRLGSFSEIVRLGLNTVGLAISAANVSSIALASIRTPAD